MPPFATLWTRARTLASGPIARGSATSLAIRLAGLALSFAQAVLTARLLGPEGYGTVAVVMAVVGIVTILCQFGFGELAVREVAARLAANDFKGLRGFIRLATRTVISLSLVGTAMLALMSFSGSLVPFNYRDILGYGAILVMPGAIILLLRGMAQGFGRVALAQIPGEVFRPAGLVLTLVAAAFAGFHFGPGEYILASTAVTALAAMIAATWLWRSERKSIAGPTDDNDIRVHTTSALPFLGLSLTVMLQGEMNTLLLGWLSSPREAGLFQPILRLMPVLMLAVQAASMRYAPRVAEFWQRGEIDRIRVVTAAFTSATTFGTFALAVAIATSGPWLLWLFGPDFRDTAPLLWWVAAAQVFNAACGPFGILFGMANRTAIAVQGQLIGLAANALTALILIPVYGAWGAVSGLIAGIVVWNCFLLFKARRILDIDPSLIGSYRLARRTR